jgi:hypothetical protein
MVALNLMRVLVGLVDDDFEVRSSQPHIGDKIASDFMLVIANYLRLPYRQ